MNGYEKETKPTKMDPYGGKPWSQIFPWQGTGWLGWQGTGEKSEQVNIHGKDQEKDINSQKDQS